MKEEEKRTIEYLKSRLYGNEGCNYIDVAQEDLRIFINLINRKEKDIEGWKKYCEEIEEEKTEMNNKNCELEFKVEKLQKENEELKEYIAIAPNLDEMTAVKYRNIQQDAYIKGRAEEQQRAEQIIYENYIPIQKVKDKIEKLNDESHAEELEDIINRKNYTITELVQYVLQELLEERK